MKKLLTIVIFILIFTVSAFSQSFYRYQGRMINLKADSGIFVIQTDEQISIEEQELVLKKQLQKGKINFSHKISNNRFLIGCDSLRSESYAYYSNVYRSDGDGIVVILPRIVVMLKPGVRLHQFLDEYDGKLIKDSGGNQRYILKCKASHSEEVLQLANELDSRNDVDWCEPEFLSEYRGDNTLYPQQYYLTNTGQDGGIAGIDINVEPAWNLTNGSSCITVAVIDAGVDRNHEDMGARVLEGFTIRNVNGEGVPQNANNLDSKAHGMACAGIIGASNNTIGIRGIASNVNILPVNIVPDATYINGQGRRISGFGTNIEIAEAINWAWRRADILSCSWGGGGPSNDITTAIDSARTFGRNGNGTLVVFASGNNYPNVADVSYPGNVNGVVTVGAINNQGVIWNYSQRGSSMDLVAPSGNVGSGDVRTTDRMGNLGENSGNYRNDFGGTSAACPQVAGVAALMLSVRPDLTEAQVRMTLQQTATEMGTSGFDNTYGYGRLNAYAAVRAVYPSISGPSVVCSSGTSFSITNLPDGASISWSTSNNISRNSSQGSNPCTFTASSSDEGWVRATITTGCGNITLPRKNVWVGNILPLGLHLTDRTTGFPHYQFCNGQANPVKAVHLDGEAFIDEWDWDVTGGYVYYNNPNGDNSEVTIYPTSSSFNVKLNAHNDCGWSGWADMGVATVSCFSYFLSLSPNPSTLETTISIEPASTKTKNTEALPEWDLEVYNQGQQLKARTQKIKGRQTVLNTSGWKEGVYIVRAKVNGEVLTEKLVVKEL